MNTNIKWLDTCRACWVRAKRGGELVLSALLLVVGILLSVALLPDLPGMAWGALNGDGEAASTLFACTSGIAVCALQWRWRVALYPQLRRDASKEETL